MPQLWNWWTVCARGCSNNRAGVEYDPKWAEATCGCGAAITVVDCPPATPQMHSGPIEPYDAPFDNSPPEE